MHDIIMTAVGNVATDIRHIQTTSGISLARFRLASSGRRYDKGTGEWVDLPPTYVSVVCWRTLADNVASSLAKGDPVVVTGRLRSHDYERDGRSETAYEIEATSVGHDLLRGTSAFQRRRRRTAAEGAEPSAGGPVAESDGLRSEPSVERAVG
jgi:single-strand DNA-binding protein